MKTRVDHLVKVLANYQEEKERSVKILDNLERLNYEERDHNKALWDIFKERWGSIKERMTSMRDKNILVSLRSLIDSIGNLSA